MQIHRCPRCRAEDIAADAHPTRLLRGGEAAPVFVCRTCYRAAELEFRIACETEGLPYERLSIRESLRRLAAFYGDRLAESDDPGTRAALADVERRLAIEPVQ